MFTDNYGFQGCVVPIGRQGIRPSSKMREDDERNGSAELLSGARIEEASVEPKRGKMEGQGKNHPRGHGINRYGQTACSTNYRSLITDGRDCGRLIKRK